MKIRNKILIAGCLIRASRQEFWQILSQWIWNLRLEFGQQVSAPSMRLTEFASSQIDEPVQASEPVQVSEPVQADESVSYGPPQWARRSFTKGFAGADFALQPDGTLRCPADHPLYPQERRVERDGSVRVLSAARIGHCRCCPLRAQCQENTTASKPRRVSAVFWPRTSTPSPPDEPLPEQPAPSRPVRMAAIGSAVSSGDTGSICCARKPFCSPLAQLSTWRERMFPSRMCLPVPNEPIGGKAREQRLARNARLPTTP
jgi:hypothetical protein